MHKWLISFLTLGQFPGSSNDLWELPIFRVQITTQRLCVLMVFPMRDSCSTEYNLNIAGIFLYFNQVYSVVYARFKRAYFLSSCYYKDLFPKLQQSGYTDNGHDRSVARLSSAKPLALASSRDQKPAWETRTPFSN